MDKSIKSIAVYFAVMIFFVMSFVGWFCGQSPATCCNRALLGAIISYIAVSIAAKAITKIIIRHIIDRKVQQLNSDKD